MPAWLRKRIESLLPRMFDFFTEQTGIPLDFKPTVYIAYGERPSGASLSMGGGGLPGMLYFNVRLGSNFRTEGHPEVSASLAWTVAHEAAHLWNAELYRNEEEDSHDWMTEGGADAFASRALLALGEMTPERFLWRASEDASLCALGLQGEPLKASARAGRYKTLYRCGATIALLTEAAVRRAKPGASIFQFWSTVFRAASARRYGEALYFRTLASFDADSEMAKALRRLLDEPVADPSSLLVATAARVGLKFERTEPPSDSEYHKLAAQRAVLAIVESGCGKGPIVNDTHAVGTGRARAECGTLAPSNAVIAVAGFNLRKDGVKAYDATRAACATSAKIDVTVSGQPAPLWIQCTTALPDRPPYLQLRRWPASPD